MLLFLGSIFLCSVVLTGVIRLYALRHKVLDLPNHRSSHTAPTPRGGGLAIVLAFMMAVIALHQMGGIDLLEVGVFSSALLVAGIGFFDDHKPVAARWRFLTHLASAAIVMFLLRGFPLILVPAPIDRLVHHWIVNPGWLGYPLGVLLLVWFLNLFNFMDGTDGIAASESAFVSLGMACLVFYLDQGLFKVAISLCAASLGFLCWNWPKARIFMGDVGSGFLGLLLGVLILLASSQAAVILYCGLILYGIFIVDASYTLLFRVFSGQKWYQAHCSHAYQRAAKQHGHLKVLYSCWLINLLWLGPMCWLVFLHPAYALFGLVLAYTPLICLAYFYNAGRLDEVRREV